MAMRTVVLTLVVPLLALGQEPQSEQGRQEPPSRPIDVSRQQQQAPLPKIDLPEFVITGTGSINPPNVEKDSLDVSGRYERNPLEDMPGARDSETIDLGLRFKQSLFSTGIVRDGLVTASLGSYFTPHILGSYGVSSSSYGFLASAEYRRTTGFVQYTDKSLADLGADGSIIFHSPNIYFNEARLSGGTSYNIEKYKFYGSTSPSAQRSRSVFGFQLGANSAIGGPWPYHGGLEYRSAGISDSTAEVSENHVTLAAGSQVPVFTVPVGINLTVELASILAQSTSSLSSVHLNVRSPEWHWNGFTLFAALNGYAVNGMLGQQGSYFYPEIRLSHQLTPVHTVFLGFHPSVQFSTLRELSAVFPYLSGNSDVRHTMNRLDISGGTESVWANDFTTRILFGYQQSSDIPLYDDSPESGIGTLVYGGTTTMASIRFDGVAYITPNDYFALALTARSTQNDHIGGSVPYRPGFEGSVQYRHRFPVEVSVTASLSAYGSRRATAFADRRAAGGFWSALKTNYEGISRLTLFLNLENLLDRRDEVWRGYRVEPFRVEIGLSYRW